MKNRAYWIDNLRAFVIILVVAHHAALAYRTNAFFNKAAYIFSSWAIVDDQRWIGMERFIYFNDIIFMALMFFISGLFVTTSLKRKGTKAFLHDRFNRLFVTFMVGASVLMLIAHYPSYTVAHGDFNIKNYIVDFFTVEYWPSGSAWFIWVLFLFNLIFALLYNFLKELWDKLSNILLFFKDKPLLLFITLFTLTWILYVPMRLNLGAYVWTGYGPFDFQKSTLLMYFGYFLLGTIFGNISLEKGLFSDTFSFMKRWQVWTGLCLFMFVLLLLIDNPSLGNPLNQLVQMNILSGTTAHAIYCTFYVATCALGCLAYLTIFKGLVNHSNRVWNSLASNSFFIYLIHYIFVLWGQYMLLQIPLPAILKFAIVFLFAISLSWLLGHIIRKNHRIIKYL